MRCRVARFGREGKWAGSAGADGVAWLTRFPTGGKNVSHISGPQRAARLNLSLNDPTSAARPPKQPRWTPPKWRSCSRSWWPRARPPTTSARGTSAVELARGRRAARRTKPPASRAGDVPEQDDLAVVDRDDLDLVHAVRARPGTLGARRRACGSGGTRGWPLTPPALRWPRRAARARACDSSALSTARGCISQALAAIRTCRRRRARGRRRRPGGTRRARTPRRGRSLRVGRGEQRPLGVERERVGPAQRLQPERAQPRARRPRAARRPRRAQRRRRRERPVPTRATGRSTMQPLGLDVRPRVAEVEEERVQPWMSQPSAARAASITASESVGWPWIMRATSG